MAKKTVYFSIDVEASGPIPGPWWMCSFGICRVDDVSIGMQRELKPLDLPGFSLPDTAGAMGVVAQGLEGDLWIEDGEDAENVQRVRDHFLEHGVPPKQAMEELTEWIKDQVGTDRPVIVGSPVTFDFMWIYWYAWRFLEEMPVFGFSGLDIRSYFMGMHGVDFMGTGKRRYLKHYPNEFAHTHDPLEDARQQGAIWRDMTAARLLAKAEEKAARKNS